jgi:DNA invertase Pin-like site-specific DNA recombinase
MTGAQNQRIAIYVTENIDAYHLPYLQMYATSLASGVAVVVEYLERSADINASERPALDQLFSDARQKEFDTVVVYSLGRFGRSARDLFLNIATLDKLGIEVFVPSIFVDKSNRTPMGKLIMQIFLAFQELESNLTTQQVGVGLTKGDRRAQHRGRPQREFPREVAFELRQGGMSWRAIGRKLGIPQSTVRAALAGVQKTPE